MCRPQLACGEVTLPLPFSRDYRSSGREELTQKLLNFRAPRINRVCSGEKANINNCKETMCDYSDATASFSLTVLCQPAGRNSEKACPAGFFHPKIKERIDREFPVKIMKGGNKMAKKPIFAVLGAGNGGMATASDLTIRGFDVHLWEHPDFEENVKPLQEIGGINLEVLPSTPLREGFAKIKLITTDIGKALEQADVVVVIVPSYAHETFASFCAPHLRDNQVVIITPGNFGGALTFFNAFKRKGSAEGVIFAEAECMIYACRKKSPTTIWIRGYKKGLRIAAIPSKFNCRVMELIQQVYPEVLPGQNIIETGLSNPNSIIHVPIMVLNSGLIDRTKGDFLFYAEGMTPKIAQLVEAIDSERLEIGKAFNTQLRSMHEQDTEWYGYQGAVGNNIYESTINNKIYQWSKAPDTFLHRYLTEDIPYGLAAIENLGGEFGVPTPITTSMINIAQLLAGIDLREKRRSLNELGLAEKTIGEILKFIHEGG